MSDPALAHVARLYYLRGLTKLEIADRLGISRFKVARLLDQARAQGVVRVEIDDPVPVDDELSHELERAFRLQMAVVVPEEQIARAAAGWLPELLGAGDVLGVAWGETLSRVADELAPQEARIPVVQICGAIAGVDAGTGPGEVAHRFAQKLRGPLYPLPAPALTSREARRDLVRNPAVRPTVQMFDRITLALVGVGVRPKNKGHVLVHVFDEEGRFEEDLDAIALSIDQLARVRLMAAAGGPKKEKAVLGALRTGYLDVLVTDERCARFALR
jgi:DNA-binding transcriptional regulator LsrR (DeoR family)